MSLVGQAYDEPGSWGRLSEKWPYLKFKDQEEYDEAWRHCVKDNAVPYGSYVGMTLCIRFETKEYKKKVYRHIKAWKRGRQMGRREGRALAGKDYI